MNASEIHCEVISVYGEKIISRQHVTKQLQNFNLRTKIHDDDKWMSVVADDMV